MSFLASCKCENLFTGLESIDEIFLAENNKHQNLSNVSSVIDNIDMIQKKGIIVNFGYLFDPKISSISEMKEQFRKITENETLLFPCFFSFVSPLLGTKVFRESVAKGELLPNLRLRDLDGCTIAFRNVKDDFSSLTEFADVVFNNLGSLVSRSYMIKKTFRYMWRYKVRWLAKLYAVYKNNIRPFSIYNPTKDYKGRTYIGGTDILDPQYYMYPSDISREDHDKYFSPIMATDSRGNPAPWLKKYLDKDNNESEKVNDSDIYQTIS
jgi:hypothetical protein